MLFSDLRVAVYICWAAALIYASTQFRALNYVLFIASYQVVTWLTVLIERAVVARRERRLVESYRMLGEAERREMVARIWSGGARVWLRQALASDLLPTADGDTERFPFPNSYRRAINRWFWLSAACAVAALLAPFALSLPRSIGWTMLVGASVLVFSAARLLRHRRHADTVIEVTPFLLAIEGPSDGRTSINWTSEIALIDFPRLKRLDVIDAQRKKVIPVHYARVGFKRILDLIVAHGKLPVADQAP